MKILVTGGAGFIGSNFIRHVLETGKDFSIVNYDKLTYAGNLANLESITSNPNYDFVKGDICDAAAVETAMGGCDAVIHFAAESHVDRSIYEPAPVIQTNVTGTFVLLEVARKISVSRFVHVSTDEVYGDIPAGAFADENFPLQPSSPYSASKAASDLLVRSYVRTYGFPAIITRSSNNYGPYQFPEKFVPLMITNALSDKALPVYGDGKQQTRMAARRGQLSRDSSRSRKGQNRGGLQHRRTGPRGKLIDRSAHPPAGWENREFALPCAGPPGSRPSLCSEQQENRNRARLEPRDLSGRWPPQDH
jgi:dTDP-glucose 4,6-dehydratase